MVAFFGEFNTTDFPGWDTSAMVNGETYYSRSRTRSSSSKYWEANYYRAKSLLGDYTDPLGSDLSVCSVFSIYEEGAPAVKKILVHSQMLYSKNRPLSVTLNTKSNIYPSAAEISVGDTVVYSNGKMWRCNQFDVPDIEIHTYRADAYFTFGQVAYYRELANSCECIIVDTPQVELVTNCKEKATAIGPSFGLRDIGSETGQITFPGVIGNYNYLGITDNISTVIPQNIFNDERIEEVFKGTSGYSLEKYFLVIPAGVGNNGWAVNTNSFHVTTNEYDIDNFFNFQQEKYAHNHGVRFFKF
jgi:hypothetical protein